MKRFLALSLAAALCGCAGSQPAPQAPTPEPEPAPEVTLVNWSDFHSAIYELTDKTGTAYGGIPAFMAAVDYYRGDGLSLLVDGGDMCQGAMPFNEARGMGMVEMMNEIGIDVSTLGNHEFDYGPGAKYPDSNRGAQREMIEASHFPWVNANVVSTIDDANYPWPYDNLKPYVIIEKGPYRIAVVGVLATETPLATNIQNVQGLEFRSPAETLRQVIPEIAAQNPDFVIVDAHITGLPDVPYEPGQELHDVRFTEEIGDILALPDDILSHIDLITSAHSHESFIAYEGNVTVTQNFNNGREITTMTLAPVAPGSTRLHIKPGSVKKHPISHVPIDTACGSSPIAFTPIDIGGVTMLPSQKGADIVAKYEGLMKENRCDVVTCMQTALQRNRAGECPLGNLVTDSMKARFPEADAAFINGGGLRIDLPAGDIYRDTLNSLMPFENFLHLVDVSGDNIVRMLKVSSSLKHYTTQVSGVSYRFEPGCSNPEDLNGDGNIDEWENNCLCDDIRIGGKKLDRKKRYKIALSDFIFKGGDNHGACFDGANVIKVDITIKENLLNYVQQHNACYSMSELVDEKKPRITTGSCNGKFAK